jgi:hypothetical protein
MNVWFNSLAGVLVVSAISLVRDGVVVFYRVMRGRCRSLGEDEPRWRKFLTGTNDKVWYQEIKEAKAFSDGVKHGR